MHLGCHWSFIISEIEVNVIDINLTLACFYGIIVWVLESKQGPPTTPSHTGIVTVAVVVVFLFVLFALVLFSWAASKGCITGIFANAALPLSLLPLPRNKPFIVLILWFRPAPVWWSLSTSSSLRPVALLRFPVLLVSFDGAALDAYSK